MKKTLLALSLLSALTANAGAYVFDGSDVDMIVNRNADVEGPFSFEDIYTLEIGTDIDKVMPTFYVVAKNEKIEDVFLYNIDPITYGLYDEEGNKYESGSVLESGNYYLKVNGVASGFSGGQYTVSTTLTNVSIVNPVPEPGILAMIGIGLLMMGSLIYKRFKGQRS